MSGVRMCDECGAVFNENLDDVSTGVMVDKNTGRQRTLDFCDVCTDIRNAGRQSQVWRRPANGSQELTRGTGVTDAVG